MKRFRAATWLLLACALLAWLPAAAQSEDELKLSMSRDWGYGGMGQIQGLFSLTARGPEGLARVVFYVDDTVIAEDAEPPFKVQFTTDSYEPGNRILRAVGVTADGRELRSNEIGVEFLSSEAAGKATVRLVVPLVGLVVLLMVGMLVGTLLLNRRRGRVPLGQPRHYGFSGGAICRKCGRPFPLSFLGFNLGLSRLTACPHCGKWVTVRRAPLAALRAAEAAELDRAEEAGQVPEESEEDRLRKALDDSRYQDV